MNRCPTYKAEATNTTTSLIIIVGSNGVFWLSYLATKETEFFDNVLRLDKDRFQGSYIQC